MKNIILSVALIATAGVANAQDAFITQVGNDNVAGNASTLLNSPQREQNGNLLGGNLQVIQQVGDGLTAVQLARGAQNAAWTYQTVSEGSAISLILQTEDSGAGGNQVARDNLAITVQDQTNGYDYDMVAQTIQTGDRNIGINLQQSGGDLVQTFDVNGAFSPAMSVQAQPVRRPRPNGAAGVRPGAFVSIGGGQP